MPVKNNFYLIMERLEAAPFGMQQEHSYKTDHVNMKIALLKSRRYSRGQPE